MYRMRGPESKARPVPDGDDTRLEDFEDSEEGLIQQA